MPTTGSRNHRKLKGLRYANPSLSRKRYEIGEPISRIDIRVLPILLTCLCALGIGFIKIPQHALLIDLWDGETEHPLIMGSVTTKGLGNHHQIVNRLTVHSHGHIMWNEKPITQGELAKLLLTIKGYTVPPIVEFEPDPNASYGRSVKVLNLLDTSGVAYRLAGTEKFCRFGNRSYAQRKTGNSLNLATTIMAREEVYPTELTEPYVFPQNHYSCEPRYSVKVPD